MRTRLLMLILTVTPVFAGSAPPKIYVDRGACPFECCHYGKWTARKAVQLFDLPGGSKVVGAVKKGEPLQALTGEVHVVPTPMDIVFKHGKFKVGERVYLLTYQGEGFQKVWADGNISSEEVTFAYNMGNEDKSCAVPNQDCWGRVTDKQESQWWVKLKLPNGKVGWSQHPEEFDGKDGCG